MNDKCQTDGGERHKTITMWITRLDLPEIFMVVKIRCFPATYLEALSTSISSNRQWKKHFTAFKKALEDDRLRQSKKCVKLKSKLQLKCFIVFKSVIYLSVSTTEQYWSRSMIFKYDIWLWGISLLILSDVLTCWMTLYNGIFSFELIYSNEIFISSNKNHHYFLQFNEVINDIFILFLVIFGTYQIICVVLLNIW